MNDPGRCARAGVPEEHRQARAKTAIALSEIDRLLAAGTRFGRVVADAGYGISAAFRQGLSERELSWAVGVPKVQNMYPAAVELLWPAARTGRPRKHPVPSEAPVAAEAVLAGAAWRRISWRRGTKGPLATEFAALRVRPAPGRRRAAQEWLASAGRGGLARGRAPCVRRAEVLPLEPAGGCAARGVGGDDQGPLGVRAGAPAAQGGAGPRPFRGPLLARPAPPRAPVPDRLRLPPAPPASEAGGKAAPGHPDRHLGRRCPRCAAASWPR